MGAVSGTPSPGCNGRGRRAGRGGAGRGQEPGRAPEPGGRLSCARPSPSSAQRPPLAALRSRRVTPYTRTRSGFHTLWAACEPNIELRATWTAVGSGAGTGSPPREGLCGDVSATLRAGAAAFRVGRLGKRGQGGRGISPAEEVTAPCERTGSEEPESGAW